MFCTNCGKSLDDSSSFCKYCGSRVKQTSESIEAVDAPKPKNRLLKAGKILTIIGAAGFLAIVFISLIIYGEVYLYNGYDFTKVLCTICIVLMGLGLVGIILGLALAGKMAPEKNTKQSLVISIVLMVLATVFSTILIANGIKEKQHEQNSYSYTPSYSSSYEMDHATYCLLYINVANVQVTHSGNYAYITGTVTNTGTYQIKYVKVRAACKDRSGNVIDTDWTYAVDSSWLNPGESKRFEMMVKDTSNAIKTATVTVVYE